MPLQPSARQSGGRPDGSVTGKASALACAIVVVLASGRSADAGINVWTSNGPDGGRINAVAMVRSNPNTVFAGTNAGVFKSVDGGATWTATNTGLTNHTVYSLEINNETARIYAGTRAGVFLSVDGGTTWAPSNNGLPAESVRAIASEQMIATPAPVAASSRARTVGPAGCR